jgi:hypothetical protein
LPLRLSIVEKVGAKVDRGTISASQEASLLVTPLFAPATAGEAAVIAALLKAGAKINRATTGGCTPLFIAAQEEHTAAVSVLIGAGAEIDIVDDHQCTPLPRKWETRQSWRCLLRQGQTSTVGVMDVHL